MMNRKWKPIPDGRANLRKGLWGESFTVYSVYRFVTKCIVCVQGHDPLTFFSLSSFLFFDWVGVLWPQLSEVLKLVCWAHCVLFPQVYLQKQVAF